MRFTVATDVLIWCAGLSQALPATFSQSHLSQHLFGGDWYKSKESATYQVCKRDAVGVGFELTMKYATASVKHENGSTADIKIDGDSKYASTMLNLWQADQPREPPFNGTSQKVKYEYRQALRKSRKLLGLPATEDIGVLASMLTKLKHAAEPMVGRPLDSALAATPSLPLFPDSDLQEAFDYAGITKLNISQESLTWVNAASAGMGRGLCEHWIDVDKCQEELLYIIPKQTLAISFDRDALRVANVLVQTTYSSVQGDVFTDYTLGRDHEHEPVVGFWVRVIGYIVHIGNKAQESIQEIVLTGEGAGEKRFLDSLWKALHDLEDTGKLDGRAADIYSQLQVPGFDALYVGARGAAETAMRWRGEAEECVEVTPPDAEPEPKKPGIWLGKLEDNLQEVGTMSFSSHKENGGFDEVQMKICIATGQRKEDGGKVDVLSDESMTTWGLDPVSMKDATTNAKEGAGDRAWAVIATLTGTVPSLGVVIFEGVPALSRLGKL